MIKNYRHQEEAINKFKDARFFGLFMDMGTGKSRIAIKIAEYKFEQKQINAILIIAPNNVHAQWIYEQFPLHCSIPYKSFVWLSGKKGNKIYSKMLNEFLIMETYKLKVFAVNVEAFQSNSILPTIAQYVKGNKCFIVIDESTRIKNLNAKRSQTIHKLNKYGYRCILTGTPTAKSPFDLWSQFQFLSSNYFDCNFFIFQHRYGIMMKGVNQYNGGNYQTLIDEKTFNIIKYKLEKIKKSRSNILMPDDYETIAIIMGVSEKNVRFIEKTKKFKRYKRLDELKKYIEKDVFAIQKKDCLDLPSKIYEKIYIDMPKEQRRIYNNLKTQLLAEYDSQELTIINKITLTIRLMQICGGFFPYIDENKKMKSKRIDKTNIKLERLKEELEEIGDDQIIIWASFISELEFLYSELKKSYTCCLYYGKIGPLTRQIMISDFKNNKYQIFIGNLATAGFGLNLQNCHIQYYFSNTFRVEERLQGEDRSHRIGQEETCVYKDIIIKNSIDEKIFENIINGKNLNDYFKNTSLKEILND